MSMHRYLFPMTAAAALVLAGAVSAAPYFQENFESATVGDDAPAGFIESPDANWTVVDTDPIAGTKSYRSENTDDGLIYALFNVPELGGPAATAKDFSFTATIRPINNNSSSGSINFGLIALANFDRSDAYYARVIGGGEMRFGTITGGNQTVEGGQDDQGNFSLGSDYLFTVTGTYFDSNADTINDSLTLFFNIEGPNFSGDGVSITYSTVKEGNYFGFASSEGGTRNVIFEVDDVKVSPIPEPASAALLALGGFMIVRRRRR